MKKMFLSLIIILSLAAIIVAPCRAAAAMSGYCGRNVTWSFDSSSGNLAIYGMGSSVTYDYVLWHNAPWNDFREEIKSVVIGGVKTIGRNLFFNCTGLTTVKLYDGLCTVKNGAFTGCTSLTTISLPQSVETLEAAFSSCTALKSISLSSKISQIDKYTFSGCDNLVNISVPNDNPYFSSANGIVYNKNKSCLYRCPPGVSGICKVPEGITRIDGSAFSGCSKIADVLLPVSVLDIGDYAFSSCTALKSINLAETQVNNIGCGVFGGCTALSSAEFPKTITEISDNMFAGCSALSSILLPDNIVKIGRGAFLSCVSLNNVYIPKSVLEIDIEAFSGCTGLSSLTVDENNPNYSNDGAVLFNRDKTALIRYITGADKEYAIPDGIVTVGDYSFSDNSILTKIILPDSVEAIGNSAFINCESLKSINIPGNVVSIGDDAFSSCGIEEIVIPDSVTSLGEYVFDSCPNLKIVTIGKGISEIKCQAFHNCNNISEIIIPNNVTHIGDNAFSYCKNLRLVKIGLGVKTIDYRAFSNLPKLEEIVIPNNVLSLKSHVFIDCTSLSKVTIGNSLAELGDSTFENCDNLKSITIPKSVKLIGSAAFRSCKGLSDIIITDSVQSIGRQAFAYCDGLNSVTVGKGVKTIESEAFYKCIALKNVTLKYGIESIENYAFDSCESLERLTLPDSIKEIGAGAFLSCKSLERITLPDKIQRINSDTFVGTGLKSVTVPNGVTEIGGCAFSGCSALSGITLPESLHTVQEAAFVHCDNIGSVRYKGAKRQWENISIGAENDGLLNAAIYFEKRDNPENDYFLPANDRIANDGKVNITDSKGLINGSYPKFTTVRPAAGNNTADLTGNWTVKNTTIETGEINSGVTVNLSGNLIVEHGIFIVSKGTVFNAASLKIGTNGKVIVNGTLNISGNILLNGGTGTISGGYLEINRSNKLFDTAAASCKNLNLTDYSRVKINGRFDINGDMYISTKNSASNYTSSGSIWLRGNMTQKKGGIFSAGDNFRPDKGFILILNQNPANAVHRLSFQSPGKSYINDLYIVKGVYDNFYDGNAPIYGVTKNIIPHSNEKGYITEENTAETKKNMNNWLTKFNQLFDTVSDGNKGYVYLESNRDYFRKEFGENACGALRTYFAALCLCMEIDPPSSFRYIGIKDSIPHYINFKAKDGWVKGKFIIDAADIASISGTRTISYKCSDGKTRRFCTLMLADIEPLGKQLQELVTSNYAEYYAGIIGLSVNAFNKEPQKNIAKLMWEGVKLSKFRGIGSSVQNTIGNCIKSDSFVNFVSKVCNFNPNRVSVLNANNAVFYQPGNIILHNEMNPAQSTSAQSVSGEFSDKNFESAVKAELGISDENELTDSVLSEITELRLPEKNIANIEGIERMTALKTLDLSGNAISDISFISGLAGLTDVNFNGNNISDISPVENLVNLKKLRLNSNCISDISWLTGLASMEVLDLGNNLLEDLSPIAGLESMLRLNVSYNSIKSVDSLSGMSMLEDLLAQHNNISDISGISNLKLQTLNLSSNSISDISSLSVHPLFKLDLSNNPLTDISPLAKKLTLASLNLSETNADDNSAGVIKSLTGLNKLSISGAKITDISNLSCLQMLEEFSAANTEIRDFSELKNMPSLHRLDISDVTVNGLSFAAALTGLEELRADNCTLTDMELINITGLANMKILSLASNCISDISFEENMPDLEYLNLSGNSSVTTDDMAILREKFEASNKTFIYGNADVSVSGIFMDSDETTVELGCAISGFAKIYPHNVTASNVIYSSSDNTIVTYQNNVLTPVSEGSAVVTARNNAGDIISECRVNVAAGSSKAIINSVEFKETSAEIQIQSLTAENMQNVSIIIAIYDKNDILKEMRAVSADIPSRSVSVHKISDVFIDENAGYFKAFVWDKDLRPLSYAKAEDIG